MGGLVPLSTEDADRIVVALKRHATECLEAEIWATNSGHVDEAEFHRARYRADVELADRVERTIRVQSRPPKGAPVDRLEA